MTTTADKTPASAGEEPSVTTSPPVEMSELLSKTSSPDLDKGAPPSQQQPKPSPQNVDAATDAPHLPAQTSNPPSQPIGSQDASKEAPAGVTAALGAHDKPVAAADGAATSEPEAIGASSESPTAKADPASGPAVIITLLLASGARHPYKIDEKYLKKRNVTVEEMNPFNVSVYTLKELILRDWREEWEPKPNAPGSIRLIYMGRMLDDRDKLKECRFNESAPNVVHMTIKPQELIDDEEAAKTGKGHSRDRDGEEQTAGCRCVIL